METFLRGLRLLPLALTAGANVALAPPRMDMPLPDTDRFIKTFPLTPFSPFAAFIISMEELESVLPIPPFLPDPVLAAGRPDTALSNRVQLPSRPYRPWKSFQFPTVAPLLLDSPSIIVV